MTMILDDTYSLVSRLASARSCPDLKELSLLRNFPSCYAARQIQHKASMVSCNCYSSSRALQITAAVHCSCHVHD